MNNLLGRLFKTNSTVTSTTTASTSTTTSTDSTVQYHTNGSPLHNSSPLKRKRATVTYQEDMLHDMLESYVAKKYEDQPQTPLKTPTTPDRSKQLKLTPPSERGQPSCVNTPKTPSAVPKLDFHNAHLIQSNEQTRPKLARSMSIATHGSASKHKSIDQDTKSTPHRQSIQPTTPSSALRQTQQLNRVGSVTQLPSSPMTSNKNYPTDQFPQVYKQLEPFCIESSLQKLGKRFNEMIYKQTESWIEDPQSNNISLCMKFTRDLLRMSHSMSVEKFEPIKQQSVGSNMLANSNRPSLEGRFKKTHDFSQLDDGNQRMIEIINVTHGLFERPDVLRRTDSKFCTLACYQDLTNTFNSSNVQPDDLAAVFKTLCVDRNEMAHPMLKVLCLVDQSVVVGTLGQVAQCIMALKGAALPSPITIDQFKDIRGTWKVTFRDYGDRLSVLHQRTDCMLTKNNPKLFPSSTPTRQPRSEFLELFHITWQVELFLDSRENPTHVQSMEVSLRDIDWTCSGTRPSVDIQQENMPLTPEQRMEAERICRVFFSVKQEVKRDANISVKSSPVRARCEGLTRFVPTTSATMGSSALMSPRGASASTSNLQSPRGASTPRKATPSLRLNYGWFTKLFSSNSGSTSVEDVLSDYAVSGSNSTKQQ